VEPLIASPDNLLRGRSEIRTALQMMVDMGIETRLELPGLVECWVWLG